MENDFDKVDESAQSRRNLHTHTHTHTHTSKPLLSQKQIGTICFSIIFSIFSLSAFACNSDEIDVLGDGTQCETSKFELTTTSFSGNFSVAMAFGGTIYIDWGDGSAIETITPADTTSTTYTHSYSVTEPHTIRFGGTATEYNTDTCSANSCVAAIGFYVNSSQTKVASISGSLADLFPQYGTAAGEFPRFYTTFGSATNLTQIPSGLFTGLTGGSYMFCSTFSGAGITSIPETLFSGITRGRERMFIYTFRNTRLTSLPETLFSGITTGASTLFYGAFWSCSNLRGNVPNTLFSGLVNNGSPQSTNMMADIFEQTTHLSKTCPTGQVKYMTGYESFWNGAVSCRPECSNGLIGAGLSDCVPSKFEITTTSFSGNFSVTFAAIGTYYIDWGDGSVQTIVRPNTTATTYTHSYAVAEPHTIKFAGLATAYNTSTGSAAIAFTVSRIASLSGSLADIFPQYGTAAGEVPRFVKTFQNATNLTQIPNTLFTGLTGGNYMFSYTFSGSGLTSLPSGLFSSITTSTGSMFQYTFQNCASLQSIPSDLFSGLTTGANYMFQYTFKGCTSLQSLPAGLFSGIRTKASYLFRYAFDGCTNLSGWVPPTMFAGLIANNSPTTSDMWTNTFNNTNLATSCPSPGMSQYITKYESSWGGVVSCECATGYYGDDVTCTACTNKPATNSTYTGRSTTNTCPWECDHGYMENNNQCDAIVCSGATYYDNNYTDIANACVNCPSGFDYNTTAGKTDISECQIHCNAGTYVANAPEVPYGYTQLEYIHFDGTNNTGAYINTGLSLVTDVLNTNTRLYADAVLYSGQASDHAIVGTGCAQGVYIGTGRNNKVMACWANGATGSSGNTSTTMQSKRLIYDLNLSAGTFTIYDESAGTYITNASGITATTANTVIPIRIGGYSFHSKPNTVQAGRANMDLYRVKIYDRDTLIFDGIPVRRNSDGKLGLYDTVSQTFKTTPSGINPVTAGPDGLAQCFDVGSGYYAGASTVNYGSAGTRNACPAGTFTVGYGHGADEANDCGRILHLGDSVIYTRRNKPTTPALNIRMENGDMYYIGLSTTDHEVSRLHFQTGETKYTAFDDSLFYGERDYDTGEKITQ